ncbi:MAG: DUF6675 family protein [Spirochaetia bacterium]
MKKSFFLFHFFLFLSASFSLEMSLFPQMTDAQKAVLLQDGSIKENPEKPTALSLLPSTTLAQSILPELITANTKTNAFSLYYIPSSHKPLPANFLNIAMDVSSLSGLLYFSRSEKKEKVLIYSVSITENEKIKNTLIPKLGAISSFVITQNDETFGIAQYSVKIQSNKTGEILFQITNLDPLKQGLITVAKPGAFNFFLGLIPTNTGVLIYGLSSNLGAPPAFVKKKADESLFNRIDAFKNWIFKAYNQAK